MSTVTVRKARLVWIFAALAALSALVWSLSSFNDVASAQPGAAPLAAAAPTEHWYAKIGDIEGEATSEFYRGWIELNSVTQTVTRAIEPGRSGTARARAGAVLEDIEVAKELDASTPKLQEAIVTGKVFPKVEIHGTATYGDAGEQVYLAFELEKVRITSYSFSGSGGDVPTDEFSMSFENYKIVYTKIDADGRKGGNVEFEWKVEEGEG